MFARRSSNERAEIVGGAINPRTKTLYGACLSHFTRVVKIGRSGTSGFTCSFVESAGTSCRVRKQPRHSSLAWIVSAQRLFNTELYTSYLVTRRVSEKCCGFQLANVRRRGRRGLGGLDARPTVDAADFRKLSRMRNRWLRRLPLRLNRRGRRCAVVAGTDWIRIAGAVRSRFKQKPVNSLSLDCYPAFLTGGRTEQANAVVAGTSVASQFYPLSDAASSIEHA